MGSNRDEGLLTRKGPREEEVERNNKSRVE
jgi:hypothetical protein